MKRAAIIGCGTIFQVHLPIIVANPEIELCAVCDNNPAVQEKLPAAAKAVPFYTDYEELLEKELPAYTQKQENTYTELYGRQHYPYQQGRIRRKPENHAESRQVILNFIEETQRINSFHKSGKYEQSPQQKTAEVHPNFPDNMFLVNLQIQS